jgi:hypothetical protein
MHVLEVEFGQHGSGHGLDGGDFESSAGDKDEQADPGSFGDEMVKNVNQWGHEQEKEGTERTAGFESDEHEVRE